jgi:uroporphyrin-3 C-methyltransferase
MTDINTDTQNIVASPDVLNVSTTPKRYRLFIVMVILSFVISLSIAALGAYVYKSNLSNNANYTKQAQILQSQLDSQVALQSEISEQNNVTSKELLSQIDQLNIQLLDIQNKNKLYSSDVEALQRIVAEKNVRHPHDWILSEVEYLINLSGRKLWLEHDITTTIGLLKAADLRIIEMRDPSLNPLRRAILEDINMLEVLPEHDLDSAVLSLSSLERRIDKLVIAGLEVPKVEGDANLALSSDVSDWKVNLKKSWDTFIESFIVISHRDVAVEALLSPEQSWYLKENLRNHLSKAEFAVYREQQDLYDMALNNAAQLIELYYDMTDKNTQQFYTSIKSLSQQKIVFSYPDQFKSAPLLSRIIEQRLTKSLTNKVAE